ncbi:MAG: FKBP-type peptidyl-prolyl cis-trans isomerase [Aquihabitans sp.]
MSKTKQLHFVALVMAAAVALGACGTQTQTLKGNVVEDGSGCSISQVPLNPSVPTITKLATAPKKLVTKDITKGVEKACEVAPNLHLTLNLVGAVADDAKVFTSTWDAGKQPITAAVGGKLLLPALETGLSGMRVGGRRQITIPAAQAYGKAGNKAQGIGPNKALIFVVDLVGVTDTPLYCNPNTGIPKGTVEGKPELVDMPTKPPTKLEIKTLQPGDGPVVKKGDKVKLHYLGLGCSTGTQFESSWDSGETLPAEAGGEGMITGFSQGIVGTRVGELRQINMPADMAYGAGGGPTGPNDPLTFIIKVTEIEPPAATTTTVAPGAATTTAPGASTTVAPTAASTTAPDSTTTTTK